MQVTSSVSSPAMPAGASPVKEQLQLSLLKKSLDSQKEASAELLRMLEGKGQTIDIRV